MKNKLLSTKLAVLWAALLFAPSAYAGDWQYQPWQKGSGADSSLHAATLSTSQRGVEFRISLESQDKQSPSWVLRLSSPDKIVELQSITAFNPDRVQEERIEILDSGRTGSGSIRAVVTPDGVNEIKYSSRIELVVTTAAAKNSAATVYTVDTTELSLAFVEFDIDVRRLEGFDVRRAYLLEYDRQQEPLNTIPQDLWMITPDEVEQHREKLGLTQEGILAMSQYQIQDALFDQEQREFDQQQAAWAERDATASAAGETLFRALGIFKFPEHSACVAPEIPETIATQEQADGFNRRVAEFENCLRANRNRDAGAYAALIGTLGYAMNPQTTEISEPEDAALSGAILLACEGLVPEPGQCLAAVETFSKQFRERSQSINQQYSQFRTSAQHLYQQ